MCYSTDLTDTFEQCLFCHVSLLPSEFRSARHGNFGTSLGARKFLNDVSLTHTKEVQTKIRCPLKKTFKGKIDVKKDILGSDITFTDLAPASGSVADHNRLNMTTARELHDFNTWVFVQAACVI